MLGLVGSLLHPSEHEQLYSLDFTRSASDYVDFGDFDIADTFSISMWVKHDTASTQQAYIAKNLGPAANIFVFLISNSGGYKYRLIIRGDVNNYASKGPATDAWIHLVVTGTVNSGSTDLVLYENKESIYTVTTSSTVVGDTTQEGGGVARLWTLGSEWDGTRGDHFDGKMTEVGMWDGVALGPDAVTAIYNGGNPLNLLHNSGDYVNSDTLIHYYRTNDSHTTTLLDSKGTIDGTISGATFNTDTPDD